MPVKAILATLSIVALMFTGCGQEAATTPNTPPPTMPGETTPGSGGTTTPDTTPNTPNNPGTPPGGQPPATPSRPEFQPPRPSDMPENGCYKNFEMLWPSENGKALAQSVYDANGNEVQFRTWQIDGTPYGEAISTFNANNKMLTNQYTVQGQLASKNENTWDEAGFQTSQKRDETGDGQWNYIWTTENHSTEGPTLGKRKWIRIDSDGDGIIDVKGAYDYDATSGRLTAINWDRKENGKINTAYNVTNTDIHDGGFTQTFFGQPQFHAYSVANTYVTINEKQKLSISTTTFTEDSVIDVINTNSYNAETGALETIDVDLKGDSTVDYQYVITGTNSMGEVTTRERHVNGVPYNKTVYTYIPGKDLISSILNYKVKVASTTGAPQWLKTDTTSVTFDENDKMIKESEESFDDEGESTGKTWSIYTYGEDGNLSTMSWDALAHGDSQAAAVYTYSNWQTDENGIKTADVTITRLANCSSEIIFSEGTETYDAEDNLISGTYTAPATPTENCDGWYNEEEQTIFNADENPLSVYSDSYGDETSTWNSMETYTWLDADRIATYSEDSDGDGSAESNQEYSYDAEGRFDSYKSDGDADADADGTWDFLLSPTTECLP